MRESPSFASVFMIAFFTSAVTAAITVLVMMRLNLVPGEDLVSVPNLSGLSQFDAQTNLQAQGLVLQIGGRKPARDAVAGTVIEQAPAAGSRVKRGTTLSVTLAGDAPTVPDLKGLTIAEATVLLERDGFRIQMGESVPHDSLPEGKIASQVPSAGMSYEPGRSIVVKSSSGPATVSVPKFVGMYLNKAKQAITDAGFKVGTISWKYSDDWEAFRILGQSPDPDQKAKPGTAINLVVNEE